MPGIQTAPGAQSPATWTNATLGAGNGLAGSPSQFLDFFITNFVVPLLIDARNNSTPLTKLLYKDVKTVGGRYIIENVQDGRNMSGVNAIHNEGNMPDPGTQGAYQYSFAVRDVYARIKITGKLLRMAMKSGGAMLSPLKYEADGIQQDLKIKQEWYMHGDGSGRRGQANGAAPATSICTIKHNQDMAGIANVTTRATLYLVPGQRIMFITSDGATVRANAAFYVKQILSDNTFSLSTTLGGAAIASLAATIGYVDGDWIVDASRDSTFSSPAWLDTGWRGEPMGLGGVFRRTGCVDGNGISIAGQQTGAQQWGNFAATAAEVGFQGVAVNSSPTGYPYDPPEWNKAIVLDASGGAARDISDPLMQQLISDIEELNGGDPTMIYSDFRQYNKYVLSLLGDKRFNSTQVAGGHTGGVTFNGLPWYKSRFALGNMVGFLDPRLFSIYENEPLGPINQLGTTQWQPLDDKDAFWMAMMTSYNLFCELRQRAGGLCVDLTG